MANMKTCKKCGLEKTLDQFGPEKRNRDGLKGACRQCDNASKLAWTHANPERRAEHLLKYESGNAGRVRDSKRNYYLRNKKKCLERVATWKRTHKDRVSASGAKRYQKKRDSILARNKIWIRTNRELARVACARRRSRRNGSIGSHTATDIQILLKLQRGRCAACFEPLRGKYHVDHREPLSRGGSNDPTNLQLLHPRCNHEKHAKDPVDFMRSRGFLL